MCMLGVIEIRHGNRNRKSVNDTSVMEPFDGVSASYKAARYRRARPAKRGLGKFIWSVTGLHQVYVGAVAIGVTLFATVSRTKPYSEIRSWLKLRMIRLNMT
ncbi:hypothetical protein DEU52_11860 [Ensifer adhaerens]|nr:hypothetical protein DEU52_11860 [Ensifer adhaerens]